ncbi:polysaccharide pyruvyl transferase family protein [Acinetobacter sp. ANC 4636]
MKTAFIITCHDVYNHGASLQCYGLSTFIKSQKLKVVVIDYKPKYLQKNFSFFYVPLGKWRRFLFIRWFYILAKVPERFQSLLRKRNFDDFTQKYIIVSLKSYTNNDELKEISKEADIYICGSDQIWNTLFSNGADPAFYLNFVDNTKVKASYAASLSTEKIYHNLEGFIRKEVEKLDFISVRENMGKELLESIGVNKHITHVLDPAFLLTTEEWDNIALNVSFSERYLLIYDFEESDLIKEIALSIASQQSLKIYTVNPGKFNYADKKFNNVGPDMFLTLIKNARYIISNSYHAVVFSIIYRKDFFVVNRAEAINVRMHDLLTLLGLESRLVSNVSDINLNDKINFNETKLEECIDFSKNFLKQVLL